MYLKNSLAFLFVFFLFLLIVHLFSHQKLNSSVNRMQMKEKKKKTMVHVIRQMKEKKEKVCFWTLYL